MNKKIVIVIALLFFTTKHYASPERVASLPYITGDGFRALADFVIDETVSNNYWQEIPRLLKDGQIIFIGNDIWTNTDYISVFYEKVHPHLHQNYILIIANMDLVFNGPLPLLLEDPKLIACFCKNIDRTHPKLIPIPIGIENEWVLKQFRGKESKDITIARHRHAHTPKDRLLYMNFSKGTYPLERERVYNLFKDQPYCFVAPSKPLMEYLHDLARSKFVLSPRGNGEDCHRTWEAMLMGCIPIVKSSNLDPLFTDLPVLIVKDWNIITQEYLESAYEQVTKKNFNHEKLFMHYWSDLVKRTQNSFRTKIPTYFGVPFHDSMEQTDHYNRKDAINDLRWQMVIDLYNAAIIKDLNYSPEPRIPKIIHRIWLGSPQPPRESYYETTWIKHHPDWQYKLWTDKDIQELNLVNKDIYNAATNWGEKSDIARYEILFRFGGLYIDTDFECLQPFDIFHHCCDFYSGLNFNINPITVFNGLIGCRAGHPILKTCISNIRKRPPHSTDPIEDIMQYTGPYYFTRCIMQNLGSDKDRIVLFPITYFYPFLPSVKEETIKEHIRPESYAMHHWHCSWQ